MIIEIKIANYRSINEEQTLSFVADRATRHPDNLIKRSNYRLLKAVGLFGANASGKSNFLKAIGAMSAFVRDSATKMNDGDPIEAAEPYRLDPATQEQPSRFEITFVTDGTVYTYGFAVTRELVHEEWLYSIPVGKSNATVLFRRLIATNRSHVHLKTDDNLDKLAPILIERTRLNALMLSTAARENIRELLPAFRFIRDIVEFYDISNKTNTLFYQAVERCKDDAVLRDQVNSLLHDADIGIENIVIDEMQIPAITSQVTPPAGVSEEFQRAIINVISGRTISVIRTEHKGTNGEIIKFSLIGDESLGTTQFFTVVVPLLVALRRGAFLAIDEIDSSMHPLLTRKLLELFQSPEANPNGAQLLFTTHDPSLLDQVLFRRDQIWLAEKCNGASTFFSLADIKPPVRNTEAFLGNYLTGRYGGTPHLGPAFDMIETGSKA